MRSKAPLKNPVLWGIMVILISCSLEGADSPYDQSYIEFRLAEDSALGYDDLQSVKVYADPSSAFNLLNIDEEGRSHLGSYDFNAATKIYMGFEYSPLYICRLEDLRVSVTRKGSQNFIDSGNYTLAFMGELPREASEKPYILIHVAEGGITLSAVNGMSGAPILTLTP